MWIFKLRRSLRDQKGQSVVAYGLILGVIAAVAAAALAGIGQGLQNTFTSISNCLGSSVGC